MANGGIIGPVNIPTSTTATGVWQQEEQYEAKVTDTWPQRALFTTKSARFNNASSDYLNRTATSGNRQVSTFSGWVKKSSEGVDTNRVFLEYNSGTNYFEIRWRDADNLRIYEELNGSTGFELITNREFADLGAWYHIVVAIDTTQGTAANRIKLYVNGVQETSFATATYPAQNYNVQMNVADKAVQIGAYSFQGSNYFNGYMSEIIWVDGTQLAPTSFGVANSDGVWTPIPYTGTFGTNGFNLQFENAAALGTDSSPNGNTFTVNNLTSIDQSTDYPVVNYCTINPLGSGAVTFSEGNLQVTKSGNGFLNAIANIGASSGKFYAEAKAISIGSVTYGSYIGFVNLDVSNKQNTADNIGETPADSAGISSGGGYIYYNGQQFTGATTATTNNDIVNLAMDLDNGRLYWGINGTYVNSGNPASGATGTGGMPIANITAGGTYTFGVSLRNDANYSWNFGSPAFAISSGNADANGYGNFEYAPPSGYYALNTANLAEFG